MKESLKHGPQRVNYKGAVYMRNTYQNRNSKIRIYVKPLPQNTPKSAGQNGAHTPYQQTNKLQKTNTTAAQNPQNQSPLTGITRSRK